MKIAVIGGGASGITAAICAKRNNSRLLVTVFERNDRILKKIPATGNGKCNLSNVKINESFYHTEDVSQLKKILSLVNPEEVEKFFKSLGIIFDEENGRLYPYSKRANAVSDALRFEAQRLGINIKFNAFVKEIKKLSNGYEIMGSFFDRVIISCGGSASPAFGTDGSSYKLLRSMNHTVSPLFPALVGVKVQENIKSLKGIRQRAVASLYRENKLIKKEEGEIQFTDYGLSGIAVMQLSSLCKKSDIISLDLFPHYNIDELYTLLKKFSSDIAYRKNEDFLTGLLHKMLCIYVLKGSGSELSSKVSSLTDKELLKISNKLKNLQFTVAGTLGYENAQVTKGGARLCEFNPETMESKVNKGLYCIGEALDCVGDCGGYNLHFAWVTALICGKSTGLK